MNVEKQFKKKYEHGISKRPAFVTANVSVNPNTMSFNVDIKSAHDVMGRGNFNNLPKMIATNAMKEDILDFIIEELTTSNVTQL
jgi:hypothetical protein